MRRFVRNRRQDLIFTPSGQQRTNGDFDAPDVAALYREARAKGDFDVAAVIAGEAVDLVHDIPPAGEIVERMARQAAELLAAAPLRYGLGRR